MLNLGDIVSRTGIGAAEELMVACLRDEQWRWVPIADGIDFYPLCFDVTHSAWHIILRVQPGVVMLPHYHTSRVVVCTLRGKWRYLERDWVHEPGSYLLEAPGDVHTFATVSSEPVELFTINEGANINLDAEGRIVGYTDVLVRLDQAKRHYAAMGQGPDVIERLIR